MKISEIISNTLINRDSLGLRYIKSSIAGHELIVHPKDWRFWDEVGKNKWEPETIDFMVSNVFKGCHYCDIGAFVGPTALLAQKLGAKVTCFEPDPAALERLYFNVRMNSESGVDIFPFALGRNDGVISMASATKFCGQAATTVHSNNFQSMPFKSLVMSWEKIFEHLGKPPFDIVKIDIEGGESELLPEMLDYFEKNKPMLHLSTHYNFIPENQKGTFIDTLKQLWNIYNLDFARSKDCILSGTPNFFLGL